MPAKKAVQTFPHQLKTVVGTFNEQVIIEQVNIDPDEENDLITIAPENIDALIFALQKAKRQLLAEGI